MRGSPLFRAALTLLVLLSLSPLLWQMTRPSAPAAAPVTAPAEKPAAKIHVVLSFTTPPWRVSIAHLGKVVWKKDSPETREEGDLEIPWPKEGVELACKVEWSQNAPLSAVRVQLTDPDDNAFERSLWGRGNLEKVLNFP